MHRDIVVRRVTDADALDLRRVMVEAVVRDAPALGYVAGEERNDILARREWEWRSAAATLKGGDAGWIAFAGDEPVGVLTGEDRSGVATFGDFWVAPDHRGGAATLGLLQAAATWAMERRVRRVECTVVRGNERARALYRHLGFRVRPRTPWAALREPRMIRMTLDVTPAAVTQAEARLRRGGAEVER